MKLSWQSVLSHIHIPLHTHMCTHTYILHTLETEEFHMRAYFNIINWDEITESPICSSMALSHSCEHSHVDVKVTLDFCIASRDYNMKANPPPVVSAHLETTRVLVFSAPAKLYVGVVWLSSVFIVSHSRVN